MQEGSCECVFRFTRDNMTDQGTTTTHLDKMYMLYCILT